MKSQAKKIVSQVNQSIEQCASFFQRPRVKRIAPFFGIALAVFILFNGFFLHGYVLDANHDRRDQTVPFDILALRSFQHGEIPQWNPYIFCGTSFMANGVNMFFYPFNWIVYSFPEKQLPILLTIFMIAHVYAAGCFGFLLFRVVIGETWWAFCAALVYILSSSSVMNITVGSSAYIVFTYVPLLLYLTLTFGRRSNEKNLFYLSAVLSLLFLGGSIQLVVYSMGIWFLFLLSSILQQWFIERKIAHSRLVLYAVISSGIAFCVSAIRLIPFAVIAKDFGASKITYDLLLKKAGTNPVDLIRFFTPEFLGTKLAGPFLGSINHIESFVCYSGVFFAFLSLYALLFLWKRQFIVGKIIIAVLFATIIATPITYVQYLLTAKTLLYFNRLAYFLPLFVSMLAGLTLKILYRDNAELKRFISFSLFVTVGVLLILWALYTGFLQRGAEAASFSAMHFSTVHFIIVTVSILACCFALRTNPRFKTTFKVVAALIIFLDVLVIARVDGSNSNPFLSKMPFFASTENREKLIKSLRSYNNMVRMFWMGEGMFTSEVIADGLYSASGYDQSPPEFISDFYTYPEKYDREKRRSISPMKMSSTCVSGAKFYYDRIRDDGAMIPQALPRVRLVNQYIIATQNEEMLKQFFSPSFDFINSVILDRDPEYPLEKDKRANGSVQIKRESNQTVVIDVTTDKPALLQFNDTFFRGWKVFVNGEEKPILRSDYAFRAVSIPAGHHEIVFTFRHPGLLLGAFFSCIGLFFLALLGMIALKRSE